MQSSLQTPENRPYVEKLAARYAEQLRSRSDSRRRAVGQLAERYDVDRVLLFRTWLARYSAALDVHARMGNLRSRLFILRLQSKCAVKLSFAERMRRTRLERKLLKGEVRVAQMYDELYRSAVMYSAQTERDTTTRGFFDELILLIGDARQALDQLPKLEKTFLAEALTHTQNRGE